MIINPGNHVLKMTEQVTQSDIPLAFIQSSDKKIKQSVRLDKSFNASTNIEYVYPFRTFNTDNITLFDANKNIVDSNIYLEHRDSGYTYIPSNSKTYIPSTFSYSVVIKKKSNYSNDVEYNISFKTYKDYDGFASDLVGAFSNENVNKPKNIIFNDNSTSIYSLTNITNKPDFLVTSLEDFKTDNDFFSERLYQNTNLWIIDDSFDGCLENITEENLVYKLDKRFLYDKIEYELENFERKSFNEEKIRTLFSTISPFQSKVLYYSSPFVGHVPIYIIHEPNNRYIILSHPNVLKNIDKTNDLVFEIIIRVYLQSYYSTDTETKPISYNMLDYYIQTKNLFNGYHPRISLTEILNQENFNSKLEYTIAKVNAVLNEPNHEKEIKYWGCNKYKELLFRKEYADNEPRKEDNEIAVYTINDTVIIYNQKNNILILLEDIPNIKCENVNDKNIVYVGAFNSSSRNINATRTTSISKDEDDKDIRFNIEYILYYDSLEKTFKLSDKNIEALSYKIPIATIKLLTDTEMDCEDIRSWGGGEIDASKNYEMIDTGSLKGRPYRVGSTMIIKLPKRFKQQKGIIEAEIKKHMSSADYPILVFQ